MNELDVEIAAAVSDPDRGRGARVHEEVGRAFGAALGHAAHAQGAAQDRPQRRRRRPRPPRRHHHHALGVRTAGLFHSSPFAFQTFRAVSEQIQSFRAVSEQF